MMKTRTSPAATVAFLAILACFAWRGAGTAQMDSRYIGFSSTLGACFDGQVTLYKGPPVVMMACISNVWTAISWKTETVAAGSIVFIASGSCPTGYAEVAALNGKMWRGTLAANANVGTSGGSDSVTPIFTGGADVSTAVSAGTPAGTNGTVSFTPAGTNAAITAGTPAGTNGASATTGNCAATNLAIGTGATTACKATAPNLTVSAQTFTGSALATHTHTFTGSSGTVPAETFTGSALGTHQHTTTATGTISAIDTKAAYINLIGCAKQ